MPDLSSLTHLLHILDSRSFASVWYWLAFATAWTFALRSPLGIPPEVVTAARRGPADGPDHAGALTLLDWLSVALPQWRIGATDGAVMAGIAAFLLATLAVLGFAYGLEMAEALSILLIPLAFLQVMRFRLAARLDAVLAGAARGETTPNAAARRAARAITRHNRAGFALSMAAVVVAAVRGTRWLLLHPMGV